MNKLLKDTQGHISDGDYWIEVLLEDSPPKESIHSIGQGYVYITKYYRNRNIGNRSIGLPVDKAHELGNILLSINPEK